MNPSVVSYRRALFATQLPVSHLYTPTHCWLSHQAGDRWRVGLTKFGLRMLGELVEVEVVATPGMPLEPGQVLGSVEGFKALSDLCGAGRGVFVGANPMLGEDLDAVMSQPYESGWFYEFDGEPDPSAVGVTEYCAWLDATIDRLREKQRAEGGS